MVTEKAKGVHSSQAQKDMLLERLREKGCRITKQRLDLIEVILESECSCCKEIFFKAKEKDNSIGVATVYRMVNLLEEIGAINRGNMYRVDCHCRKEESACTIVLDDGTVHELSASLWDTVLRSGLEACGFLKDQGIASVRVFPCHCK